MYKLIFLCNGTKVPFEQHSTILCADLERALALASMFQKISTPEVSFGAIVVEPFNQQDYETEKK